MLTKGIIKELPQLGSNIFKVRIPLFECAGRADSINKSSNQSIVDALLCYTPGTISGYKVDDVVFVAFEEDKLSDAVILGKLYVNDNIEPTSKQLCKSLEVSDIAKLPNGTTIGEITYPRLVDVIRKVDNL